MDAADGVPAVTAVGLRRRLVRRGEDGVAVDGTGVRLLPDGVFTSGAGGSRPSSGVTSMLSWSVTDGLLVANSVSIDSDWLKLVFEGERRSAC